MAKFNELNFKGKKVLLRSDLNVPIRKGKITDDSRLKASFPTVERIVSFGGSVILMSHLGRPQKKKTETGAIDKNAFSLQSVADYLKKEWPYPIKFASDVGGEVSRELATQLKTGEILLLENTRFEAGEESGDENLAKKLAGLGDLFVNDAFGTAHRNHASTAILAHYFDGAEKAFGLLMEKELNEANKLMDNPEKPYTVILGGAKVSDKITLLKNLMDKANHILIGGGMAYTFIMAKGGKTGQSLVEPDKLEYVKELLVKAEKNNSQIHLPIDTAAAKSFSENAERGLFPSDQTPDDYMGLDIGPQTISSFSKIIEQSKTLFWNGPMGVFELEPFSSGTIEVAKSIGRATQNGAYSLIGGGDSVAAVNKFELGDQMSFLSTGGGAMLTLLEGGELPSIQAMEK